jgi:uncharacterized MAPEG superfamily protein
MDASSIDPLARTAYVLALAGLFLKYVVIIALQGGMRFRTRTFRWAEDGAAFGGAPAVGLEHGVVERAQHALRNDGESQPFFYVVGWVWVALGGGGAVACGAFAVYVVARWLHTALLIRPHQPLRNRVFTIGQLVLLALVVDVVRRAL